MSIITKRGDDGYTDAMYGGRLSKNSSEVIACGDIDELNTTLGLVRVSGITSQLEQIIDTVQQHLVSLMGLVSVPSEKRQKYLTDGYPSITAEQVEWLEKTAGHIDISFTDWARPGAAGSVPAAWLDQARTICRRAERSAWAMGEELPLEACHFLNRLSDLLWLLARQLEQADQDECNS
ncbi:MAG: cob(I)yrinic acid a,c-diamide adenosyltransferase [Akkermansiaceae bacterium]